MSKNCLKCGTLLPDEAEFCTKCGAEQKEAAEKPAKTGRGYEVRQPGPGRPLKSQPAPPQGKPAKKGGCLMKLLLPVLLLVFLYTGFVEPGFFNNTPPIDPGSHTRAGASTKAANPKETKPADPGETRPADPGDTVKTGSSKAIQASPCEGVSVSAPRDAFWQDTEIKMEPLTQADESLLKTVSSLEEDGYRAIAGWEVNAGLEDEEVIPGSYTVSLDLKTLGISEIFHDYLCVFRVAQDGSYYQYASRVENGKLIYSADQNSITLLVVGDWLLRGLIVTGIVYYGYPIVKNWYEQEFTAPMKYYYDANKKMAELNCSNRYGSYILRWSPADLGIDEEANMKKMEELSAKYRGRAQELYKAYEEDKLFNATNILNIFSRNKSVDEVVLEAIQKDPEYQRLQKEINLPDTVDYAIGCIDMSYKYLKEQEYMKVSTSVVEISSTSGGGNLATAMSRKIKTPWVQINLKSVQDGGQAARDTFLVTMTHELLHVFQRGYRYWWTDSVRFDEMTAIVVERRAASHYQMAGIIDWDSKMEMNPTEYWSTLKLPIDKYYAPGDDTTVMQHEGYTLCEYVLTADGTKLMGEVSDEFSFTIHREVQNDLSKFTDMWIPVDIPWEKFKTSDWVLGLIYLEEDNEFGEYEGYASGWSTARSRWLEIKYFDYDPKTGILTIDFEKNAPDKAMGTATFRINGAGHLEMTNSGGTFEFYRAPKDRD